MALDDDGLDDWVVAATGSPQPYAASLARYFGPGLFGRMSGRLYTAWGLAGIAGPWIAGTSFDRTHAYTAAIAIAACAMAMGAVLSLALPPAPAPVRAR